MLATLQLLLALGLGRSAIVVDLVGTVASVAVAALVLSRRQPPPARGEDVVAEAEGVVRQDGRRQPV
jgi:hypothetical protein